MKRPLCKDYMQAGPLLDISVTSGNIEELHLPHWICIGEQSCNYTYEQKTGTHIHFHFLVIKIVHVLNFNRSKHHHVRHVCSSTSGRQWQCCWQCCGTSACSDNIPHHVLPAHFVAERGHDQKETGHSDLLRCVDIQEKQRIPHIGCLPGAT